VEDPPRVTVIDPRAPGRPVSVWAIGPRDVLEGGRDPWEPTTRQRRSTRVVTALGMVLVVAWFGVDQVRSDRAAARAAESAVQLWAEGLDTQQPGVVRLALRNQGPAAVQVVQATLNQPGYGLARGTTVAPSSATTLTFPDAAACGTHLLRRPVDEVRVTLRTSVGSLVRRDITLGPSAFRVVNAPAWRRCGYLPMEDALRFELLPVRETADGVVLHALVSNTSVLPLTLRELMPGAGLALSTTPALPVTLAPRPYAEGPDTLVGLGIRVTVRDCATLRMRTPFDRGSRPAASWRFLRGWLLRDSSISEVQLPLAFSTPGEDRFVEGVAAAMRHTCG
jgi:hypothetical protein